MNAMEKYLSNISSQGVTPAIAQAIVRKYIPLLGISRDFIDLGVGCWYCLIDGYSSRWVITQVAIRYAILFALCEYGCTALSFCGLMNVITSCINRQPVIPLTDTQVKRV